MQDEAYERELRELGILPDSPLGRALIKLDERTRRLEEAAHIAVDPDPDIGLP